MRTAGGRRAFVRAVHPALDRSSPEPHRCEARITARLPLAASAELAAVLGALDHHDLDALLARHTGPASTRRPQRGQRARRAGGGGSVPPALVRRRLEDPR